MSKLDLKRGYDAEAQNDQMNLDAMQNQVQVRKKDVEIAEAHLATAEDKFAAATELKALADRILAQEPQLGITASARHDLEKAEKVLKWCAEEIPNLKQRLERAKADLATWEERVKNFDTSGLKAKRALDEIRIRCRIPGR